MKNVVWSLLWFVFVFCATLLGFGVYMRNNIIKSYGKPMWKSWR